MKLVKVVGCPDVRTCFALVVCFHRKIKLPFFCRREIKLFRSMWDNSISRVGGLRISYCTIHHLRVNLKCQTFPISSTMAHLQKCCGANIAKRMPLLHILLSRGFLQMLIDETRDGCECALVFLESLSLNVSHNGVCSRGSFVLGLTRVKQGAEVLPQRQIDSLGLVDNRRGGRLRTQDPTPITGALEFSRGRSS